MRPARVVSVLMSALVMIAGAGSTSPAAAVTDQLQDSAIKTYTVDPDNAVIHVTTAYTLTNKAPSKTKRYTCTQYYVIPGYGRVPYTTTCTTRTDYYYNYYEEWVERDATAFNAKGDSGSASVKPGKRDGNYRLVRIDFSRLNYGRTRKLTFTYDLPAGGPRSPAIRRAGNVYSSFCADGPGADSGRLQVVVPGGYDMSYGPSFTLTTSGGKKVFTTGVMKEPWKFSACFKGINEDGYSSTQLTTSDGRSVTIQAWKEDAQWAEAVRTAVEGDLAALTRVIDADGDRQALTIREDTPRDGLAGTSSFDAKSGILSLSEMIATRPDVTRTLPGIWLGRTFAERWLTEGYAGWAANAAGVASEPCTKPGSYPGSGAPNLSSWSTVLSQPGSKDAEIESYKRQAACFIVSSVAVAIGPERTTDTLKSLREGKDTFTPDSPRTGGTLLRWRDWLDVVEQRGLLPADADADLAATLLRTCGVTTLDALLASHAKARNDYVALLELTGAPAPAPVTAGLSAWDFEAAGAAMVAATSAWATAASAATTLAGVNVDGGPVQLAVASAGSQEELDAAKALAERQSGLAVDVADALAIAHAPRDAVQELGLLGTSLPDEAAAIDAVTRIDGDAADAAAAEIRSVFGAARDAGVQRLAVVGSVIALAFGLAIVLLRIRRRRRARRAAADGDDSSGQPQADEMAL